MSNDDLEKAKKFIGYKPPEEAEEEARKRLEAEVAIYPPDSDLEVLRVILDPPAPEPPLTQAPASLTPEEQTAYRKKFEAVKNRVIKAGIVHPPKIKVPPGPPITRLTDAGPKPYTGKLVSEKQKKLGLVHDHIITSRTLNHALEVAVLSKNFTGELSRLGDLEEILLDCVIDNLAKEEVLPDPRKHALTAREEMLVLKTKVTDERLPWRVMCEDEVREKTGLTKKDQLPGRVIEKGFKSLAQKAHFSGKFKSFFRDGKYHELELLCAHLFPKMLVRREGEAILPEPPDNKKKRWFLFQIDGPLSVLLKDGIARGRFGAFPPALYQKRVDWPALRIARRYDLYAGDADGVKFSYSDLLTLLDLPDAVNVTQRLKLFDRYFRLVAETMNAQVSKRYRGRHTIYKLISRRLLRSRRRNPAQKPL